MTTQELDKMKVREVVCKYGILFVNGAITKEQYDRILIYCRNRTGKQGNLLKDANKLFN